MSVQFHPFIPLDNLEKRIVKKDGSPLHGEIDIYRKLYMDLEKSDLHWEVWHDIKLPDHSDAYNPYNKTSGQIDFLILSVEGIIVLEVKGGSISTKNNTFYYGKYFEKKMSQDPFRQAEGYKYTLKDDILNNITNCFFCEAVAFPHVNYRFGSRVLDNKILWTEYLAPKYDNSLESFLLKVYRSTKEKHKKHFREYSKLHSNELESIKKILSPILYDQNELDNINTLEWLRVDNIEILQSLQKNARIMIEGPPGSGKTTLAKAYIDKQKNKNGIYICWNNFLMEHTKNILEDRKGTNIEVTTFFNYVLKLCPNISRNDLINQSEEGFYNIFKHRADELKKENKLPNYDFIVIDEAQDMFDRGIDILINLFSGYNKNGLLNGNALVLYDIDQSYSNGNRAVLEIADLMSDYFAHFKLNDIKRSSQNPNIRELSKIALLNPKDLLSQNLSALENNIRIVSFITLTELKDYIVKHTLTSIRSPNSSLVGADCILLIESSLLNRPMDDEPDIEYLLTIKDVEELTKKNLSDNKNILRYTSIIKYKGLEKRQVTLVVKSPSELNKYELYVGITRAITNLEILILL